MKKRNLVIYSLVGIVVVVVLFTLRIGDPHQEYIKKVMATRNNKDQFMKSKESPLSQGQKRAFQELSYFAIDTAYRMRAQIKYKPDRRIIHIPTNTGEQRRYVDIAAISFRLNGKSYSLDLWQSVDDSGSDLFLAFTDMTNGSGSYGGGRYLDLDAGDIENESITVDFNFAYNPYCAYNFNYSCPLPPAGNHINQAIAAGEKSFE